MECDNPMKALKCRIIATVDGKEVVSKLVTPYTPAPVNGGCGQCGRGQCDSLLSHSASSASLQLILDERILHHLSNIETSSSECTHCQYTLPVPSTVDTP